MMRRRTTAAAAARLRLLAALLVALAAAPLAAIGLSGCETTLEDVRQWENAKQRADKMKEFILDDGTSIEVKVESAMILVRKNESSNLVAIFEELDAGTRQAIVAGVLPQLEEMSRSEDQGAQLKAKDGAYFLAQTSPSAADRERLDQIMLTWIDGDNFHRPTGQVGLAYQDMILQTLGPKALPVLEHVIVDKFDKLASARTPEFKGKKAQEILGLVEMTQQLNLGDADGMIARVFLERAEKMYPDLPEVFDVPFEKNKHDTLKALAEKIVLDPAYTHADLNNRKAFILNEYYANVQPREGIRVCGKVIREDRSGFLRWMCAQTLLRVAREDGIDHVMLGLPDDPAALRMPDDHPLAGHEDQVGEFWTETASFCRSSLALTGQPPVEKFRKYLQSSRTVEKLVAIECLSWLGSAEDVAALKAVTDTTDISAWNPPGEATTLAALAAHAASEHATRSAQQ